MMKEQKIRILLGAVMVLSLLIASCAPASIPTPQTAPSSAPTPAPTPPSAPAPTPTSTVPTPEHQQEEVYYVLYSTDEPERYILPTFEELEREKGELTRHYPRTVKGIWEPAPDFSNRLIRKRLPELGDVGVNTFHVLPHYFYINDELVLRSVMVSEHQGKPVYLIGEKAEREYIDQVVKAKKAGFAVSITPIYFGHEVEAVPDQDAFDEFALQQARKWAQVAEEYRVEYFSPFGEYGKHMSDQGLSKADLAERMNNWNRKALAEVRPIFKGKIVLKTSAAFLGSYSAQSALGYDMLAIAYGLTNTAKPGEQLRESVQRRFSDAQMVAERDDVEWMVGEFGLRIEGHFEEQQRTELFRLVLEEYERALKEEDKPVGFTVFTWESPDGKIRETEIVPFLKQFFHDIDSAEFDGTE